MGKDSNLDPATPGQLLCSCLRPVRVHLPAQLCPKRGLNLPCQGLKSNREAWGHFGVTRVSAGSLCASF